jgi:hypothetical protein
MRGSIDLYEARTAVARIVLTPSCMSMTRKSRGFMTDLRAWLVQLGVTVIECVFLGCGGALLRAAVPCRTRPPQSHDPFR